MSAAGRRWPTWPAWARHPATLALAGGLLFLALFSWRYAQVDGELYRWRDDGVITLSHARNWVDFGFIGVNPSGERLEASSAPVQLLIYAAAYALTGVGYGAFMDAQTVICSFLLGALFATALADRPVLALGGAAAAGYALARLPAFLLWHGSGMENAITHVLLLATVGLLAHAGRTRRVDARWAVLPFLASISRVDGIFHVAPLMLVFCIWWHVAVRDHQARRLAMVVAGLWLAFNALRYFYFGSLLPNTAVAQGIGIGERLIELAQLNPMVLDASFQTAGVLFQRHGVYLLLLALPFVLFTPVAGPGVLLLGLAMCGVLTGFATPFVFGNARLDPARTTTQMAPFVMLAVAAAVHAGGAIGRARAYGVLACLVVVVMLHTSRAGGAYPLCCSVRDFDSVRRQFEDIARSEGISRPTVSNPDLGVLTWHKQLNVVDLGLLGSPLVARLQGTPALNDYFFEYAAPDMVEIHGWWSCRYAALLTDPRFRAAYGPAGGGEARTHGCGNAIVPAGVWVRRAVLRDAGTPERRLMEDLQRDPDPMRVESEFARCGAVAPGEAFSPRCAYVARTVYRLLPELRARVPQARLEALFERSPSRPFDLALVAGARDALAWRGALAALERR